MTPNDKAKIIIVALVVILAAVIVYTVYDEEPGRSYTVSMSYDGEMGEATGEGTYVGGEEVTVTATPDRGYGFKGWYLGTEIVSEDQEYTFTIQSDVSLTPTFARICYINVDYDHRYGNVTGNGEYLEGDLCVLIATPADGCSFAGWYTDDGYRITENNRYAFTVESTEIYTADFGQNGIVVDVTSNDNSMGRISPDAASLRYGDDLTIRAIPNKGFVLDHWTVDGTYIDASYSLTLENIRANTLVTANFKVMECDVELECDSTMGRITGVSEGTYDYGTVVQIQAVPMGGYAFDHWEIDGSIFMNLSMSLTIDGNMTIRAVFTQV